MCQFLVTEFPADKMDVGTALLRQQTETMEAINHECCVPFTSWTRVYRKYELCGRTKTLWRSRVHKL